MLSKKYLFRVSGGSEFQSRGPMTEKAFLPSDDLTYGMERTSDLGVLTWTQFLENHSDYHELKKLISTSINSASLV